MSREVYLVQRAALDMGEDQVDSGCEGFVPAVPLRVFADEAAAQAYRRDVERMMRAELCPFQLGDTWELCDMDEDAFCERVKALGLPPPEVKTLSSRFGVFQGLDLLGWWAQVVPTMTEEQRDAVWELCSRVIVVSVVRLALTP
jgi:hypothetical protein